MARGTVKPTNNRKKLNLDYSYGEDSKTTSIQNESEIIIENGDKDEEEIIDDDINNDNELIIAGSKKAIKDKTFKDQDKKRRAKEFQKSKEKGQKYLGYNDFLNNDERDPNGYKFDESDDFKKLDEIGWNRLIGFLLIRLLAPIILVLHGVISGLVLWKVYEFDFSVDGDLIANNRMPWIAGAWSINLFLVHWLSKYLFRHNYYKLRRAVQN